MPDTESPEFQAALKKACEEEYNAYLFGDKKQAKAAEKLGETERKMLVESKRFERRAESMRNRAESEMHSHRSGMLNLPKGPVLPDNPTREDFDRYRVEMDAYRENIRVQTNFIELLRERGITVGNANIGLRCPECGDVDHHNRMGEIPWCMKCNCALEKSGVKTKEKQMRIRFMGKQKPNLPNIYRGLPEEHTPFVLSREEINARRTSKESKG